MRRGGCYSNKDYQRGHLFFISYKYTPYLPIYARLMSIHFSNDPVVSIASVISQEQSYTRSVRRFQIIDSLGAIRMSMACQRLADAISRRYFMGTGTSEGLGSKKM